MQTQLAAHEVVTPTSKNLRASTTLGEVEKSQEASVWVLNNTKPKGNVTVEMNDGQGNKTVVTVPVTWIPVDMSTQATKSALLASPNFRRMISMGMLILVSEKIAQATMQTPAAQKEALRIYSRVQDMINSLDSLPQAAQKEIAESSGDVSGMAMQLAMGSDLDEDQVMTTLQGNISAMTEVDLRYLAENSKFARVKEFCAESLAG